MFGVVSLMRSVARRVVDGTHCGASLDQGLDPIGNARKPDRGLCQLCRT